MIIAIIGNVGSGKSVSATKKIVDSNSYCFVNFAVNKPNVIRLKKEDIVKEEVVGMTKAGKPIKELKVNWDFWNEALKNYGEYHLVLDEVHNIINSRRAMSTWNTLCGQWISQIRKLIGTSERTHIYLITQRINRIDVAFRDLLHYIIYCEKLVTNDVMATKTSFDGKESIAELPVTWIIQYYFSGENCVNKFDAFRYDGAKTYDYRTGFIANPYYKYYDSYEMFGETAYL